MINPYEGLELDELFSQAVVERDNTRLDAVVWNVYFQGPIFDTVSVEAADAQAAVVAVRLLAEAINDGVEELSLAEKLAAKLVELHVIEQKDADDIKVAVAEVALPAQVDGAVEL